MQVLQLSFSGSISCAALSERRNKREKAVNINSNSLYDFKLDNRSKEGDLHAYTIKLVLHLSRRSRVEAGCPFLLHDEC